MLPRRRPGITRPAHPRIPGRARCRNTLDHIVYDVRLEPLSVEVMNAGNSDHLPVVGVFVLSSSPVASAQATAMKKMSNGTR